MRSHEPAGLPAEGTLGLVVLYGADRPAADLPAVRGLVDQVEELLVVRNGRVIEDPDKDSSFSSIRFETNRGTAAAWNAGLAWALRRNRRYLYLLDQDSTPLASAVAAAVREVECEGVAAVVQPVRRDRLRLDPFPWNTVASGSLYDVAALASVGGFDERLFVDEVDHELLARLQYAGHQVRPLPHPTIDHRVGSPRPVKVLAWFAKATGHSADRRRLQGYSVGVLVRRYLLPAPATAGRRLVRLALTATKDVAAGEATAARALVSGLLGGLATGRPPTQAAERPCPYCDGPLLGRFADVADWRFGAGAPADVYRCAGCGALAAGRVPTPEEIASWYARYYTHDSEPAGPPRWSTVWPTPSRRAELASLRRYLSEPGETGRFLDVGTGAGERLLHFAGAGWDAVGQDLDPEAGRLARDRGVVVHRCPVADLIGREEPFDLIGLNHVLEHAAEPAELLAACRALLRSGGRICVIAPNADSLGRLLFGRWWFGLEQPRHLAIPTLASMERVGTRLGLRGTSSRSVAANGAVILGGSLARVWVPRLPHALQAGAAMAAAGGGQALARAATFLGGRRGEEIVWVGVAEDQGPPVTPASVSGRRDVQTSW